MNSIEEKTDKDRMPPMWLMLFVILSFYLLAIITVKELGLNDNIESDIKKIRQDDNGPQTVKDLNVVMRVIGPFFAVLTVIVILWSLFVNIGTILFIWYVDIFYSKEPVGLCAIIKDFMYGDDK